ncbi:hypothetical protein BJ322DRAFT_586429 [Thelephora terrestris]|uniref:Uncharacterized protein n=1 Tax=Thelephora terrestris TaxID=56493 RepID=A0A9P6L8X2_9AGAM|nr:hypothetical protein BJ322DRAFT_586429 [Thelephora terrestris]
MPASSTVLSSDLFTSPARFMTCTKARHEIINIRIANGKLSKAFQQSVPLWAVVICVVASAASLGYGLISWSLVYSDSLSTGKIVLGAVLVPVACLLSGLRWAYEMVSSTMWVLIRVTQNIHRSGGE